MDTKLLKHAQEYIEKMANGINPLNNEIIKDSDLLNNIKISRCLFYVNNILKDVINSKDNIKPIKKPFYLSKEELTKYEYPNYSLSITKILKKINNLIDNPETQKLKIRELVNWLLEKNIIKIIEINGRQSKIPTQFGRELGLYTEHINTLTKEYDKIMYSKQAQEYIINNFDSLLNFIQEKN